MNRLRFKVYPMVLVAGLCFFDSQPAAAAGPQVYAGSCASSSFLVDGAGTLNAWGENGFGSLGIGGYAGQVTPVAVPFPAGVHGWRTVVTANGFNAGWTYAIGDDSQLYGAGNVLLPSSFGNVTLAFPQYLTQIPLPAGVGGWSAVSASDSGWLAVSTNGSIYGNIDGSVLWPPRPGATHWTQVAVCAYSGVNRLDLFALDDRGKLFGLYSGTAWFSSPTFVEIPVPVGATAWTNISAGAYHILAQANDGNLYGWGDNEVGQIGGNSFNYTNAPQRIALPPGKTGWAAISAGGYHSLATTSDGQLFAWGENSRGQLGLGYPVSNQNSPAAVAGLTNVTAIAAGYEHSLAIADGQAFAWGDNEVGELGAGFSSPYYPSPFLSQFNYDITATDAPVLPVISIIAPDPYASETTWLSTFDPLATNTGRFEISRAVATPTDLLVKLSIGGSAFNGVDYAALPASVVIPANSNSVSLVVFPTGDTLAASPSTVTITLLSDAAYQPGNSTNATVTLVQYDPDSNPSLPVLTFQIFVGTNLNGQAFVVQSSTNLINWSEMGTGLNVWGVVTVTETNRMVFRQRFFRAFPQVAP